MNWIILLLISINFSFAADNYDRFEILSGEKKSTKVKGYWDKKFSEQKYLYGKKPAKFLAENFEYIPKSSKVLDVASSEGRNAVFMARMGYKVVAVDISSVALKKSRDLAKEYSVRIETVLTPMENYKPKEGSFDAIICFYFVNKKLNRKLVSWLKPGGILIYESHTTRQRKVKGHENYELSYLLKPGELLTLFPGLKILKYEEPLHTGEYTSSIILQKPF